MNTYSAADKPDQGTVIRLADQFIYILKRCRASYESKKDFKSAKNSN